jgi:cytoskeleton protein RodZ
MARGNFGQRLKRERELREVTLKEITAATRISQRFLDAMEEEDWEKLPGGVFNRGFVRSVARYLGLDEEALLAEYDLAHGAQLPAADHSENRIPSPPKWIPAAMLLGMLLLLAGLITGGIYAWRRYAARRAEKQAQSSVAHDLSITPTVSTPATPRISDSPQKQEGATEGLPLDLFVSVRLPTRVRIEADGKLLLDAELGAGENRRFRAAEQFEIRATDSGAVVLEMNGRAMPPIGAPGTSGTITLTSKDLRQAPIGNTQP